MYKDGKNIVSKILTNILLTCLLIAGSAMQAEASDITNISEINTISQKSVSVFEINLVYVDAQSESHIIKSGSGFLTGNGEGVSYVITSRETVHADEELCVQIIQEYGLEAEDEIEFIPRLVVQNDVVMDAEIVVSSEEIGFAVLKLQQPVYGRDALYFSPDSTNSQAMDNVYAIGRDEIVAEGQIFKRLEESEISLIWHNAILTGIGSGTPLLDEQGNVIAINTQLLETGYMQAVDMTEVAAILDVFGVPYTVAEAVEITPIIEQTDMVETQTIEQETQTIQEGEVEKAEIATEENAETFEQGKLPVIFWIGIGVVILLVVGIIILVCKIVAGDKKNSKNEPVQKDVQKEQTPSFAQFQQQPSSSNETTVLGMNSSMDMEATTLLSNRMGMDECKGYLVREKSGERIYLNKSLFIIGTDGLRVDYCIKDNKSVSRVHAQIRQIMGEFTLENLNATNGTYVNGIKLQDNGASPLHSGDSVSLANERFVFYV